MKLSIFYAFVLWASIVECRNRWDDQYRQSDKYLKRLQEVEKSFPYQGIGNYYGVNEVNHPTIYKALILDKRHPVLQVHHSPEFKRAAIVRKKRQVDTLGGSLIAGASFFDDNKVLKPLMHGKENASTELKNVTISKNTILEVSLLALNDTVKKINISSTNLLSNEIQKTTTMSVNYTANTMQEVALA